MMRKAMGVLLIMFALSACAANEPSFGSVASNLPPLPAGQARIFFYRWLEPYESLSMSTVYLNGAPVGASQTGAVLYRDVAPGEYFISVYSRGTYPDQFKTVPVAAGQVVYVRIESLSNYQGACGSWGGCPVDDFVVQVVGAGVASKEMQSLKFIQG